MIDRKAQSRRDKRRHAQQLRAAAHPKKFPLPEKQIYVAWLPLALPGAFESAMALMATMALPRGRRSRGGVT